LVPVLGLGSIILVLGTPLFFAPRYPLLFAEPAIILGALAGLGTIAITMALCRPSSSQYHRVRLLTQLSGWAVTVGCLVLFARYPHSEAPAGLLFAVASAAAGPGRASLVRGILICEVLLLGLVVAQRYLLHVSDSAGAQETFVSWTILILVVATVARIISRSRVTTREVPIPIAPVAPAPESASPASAEAPTHALLSPREREILPFLATYYEIPRLAAVLDIKPATIKSHQERVGAKLATPDGERSTIVAEAKARGLLSEEKVRRAEESVRTALAARREVGGATPSASGNSRAAGSSSRIAPERRIG
jgi:DNA-binding CsgD family transcriptional regulator